MGRTIHYGFKLTKDLSRDNIDKLLAITKEYQDKYTWTCETVGFSNFQFYPNWERFRRLKGEDYPNMKIWQEVDQTYKSNEKKKLNEYDNIMDLKMRHLVKFHQENDNGMPDLKEFRGFTKVADNEFNSLLVIMWLTEVSKLIPTTKISVKDEGDFLKLPIIIKNTKAIPDWKRIEDQEKHCNNHKEDYWSKECLEKLDKGIKDYYDSGVKVESVKSQYVPVSVFTRQVNPKDFENHPEFKTIVLNIGEKTIGDFSQTMAGFAGEYWNKGKRELSEHRSQEGTEFIMNFLNGLATKKEEDK